MQLVSTSFRFSAIARERKKKDFFFHSSFFWFLVSGFQAVSKFHRHKQTQDTDISNGYTIHCFFFFWTTFHSTFHILQCICILYIECKMWGNVECRMNTCHRIRRQKREREWERKKGVKMTFPWNLKVLWKWKQERGKVRVAYSSISTFYILHVLKSTVYSRECRFRSHFLYKSQTCVYVFEFFGVWSSKLYSTKYLQSKSKFWVRAKQENISNKRKEKRGMDEEWGGRVRMRTRPTYKSFTNLESGLIFFFSFF